MRRYLKLLADSSGNVAKGSTSIDRVASDFGVDSQSLRDYRDGQEEALGRDAVAMFAKYLGRPDADMLGYPLDDALGIGDADGVNTFSSLLAEESVRRARLLTYHLVDSTRTEAHSALDAWADTAVTGNIGEGARYAGGFEPTVYNAADRTVQMMKNLEAKVNGQLLPDDQKLLAFRGMMKYGDQFGEISVKQTQGRYDIDALLPLHCRTMQIVRDPKTFAYDPNYAYKQVLIGQIEPVAKFPEWKIVHFANTINWGDWYGESLFYSCLRSHMQVEAMESGMMTRRLERAPMRYKHTVDVGMSDGSDESVKKQLKQWQDRNKKVRTVDGNRNFRVQKITLPAGEDFYLPKRDKEDVSDIEVLKGDEMIGEIEDFKHFWKKWLAGLGVPAAHLGYEDDSSKTGVNDKHIVFARRVRRAQLKFIKGINHLYWVQMILRGIDPRSVRYTIFPPSMGTRDELIRAQILLSRATTVQYLSAALGQSGKMPSIQWFLKYVMEYDDAVFEDDQLGLVKVMQKSGSGAGSFKNAPPKNVKDRREFERLGQEALKNPIIAQQRETIDFLLEERAIGMKSPYLNEKFGRMTLPHFAGRFDEFVRSIGVKELRAA